MEQFEAMSPDMFQQQMMESFCNLINGQLLLAETFAEANQSMKNTIAELTKTIEQSHAEIKNELKDLKTILKHFMTSNPCNTRSILKPRSPAPPPTAVGCNSKQVVQNMFDKLHSKIKEIHTPSKSSNGSPVEATVVRNDAEQQTEFQNERIVIQPTADEVQNIIIIKTEMIEDDVVEVNGTKRKNSSSTSDSDDERGAQKTKTKPKNKAKRQTKAKSKAKKPSERKSTSTKKSKKESDDSKNKKTSRNRVPTQKKVLYDLNKQTESQSEEESPRTSLSNHVNRNTDKMVETSDDDDSDNYLYQSTLKPSVRVTRGRGTARRAMRCRP